MMGLAYVNEVIVIVARVKRSVEVNNQHDVTSLIIIIILCILIFISGCSHVMNPVIMPTVKLLSHVIRIVWNDVNVVECIVLLSVYVQ